MGRFTTILRWFGLLGAALGVLLCLGGCMALGPNEEQSTEDPKPWNQPASWEGSVIGVPL